MNILITDAGAIGLGLGTSMISQGHNVIFYARNETAKSLKENGVKRTGIIQELKYSPNEFEVFTNLKDMEKNYIDFVFITSKTLANDEISKSLNENRNILKEDCKMIVFQNGFRNDDYY